eukprot:CAMPEP_0195305048 /NCGR_PEP_ID=MMETSP0707-20130614/35581_1 /TAXON_ID=33640 /ORGANISM="Asterionellopsis glacialis, Strain CCMP134" /LENGTH=295 /DNA_ID=CAMNT_0040369053 /DNA_START=205 /DNA_END=1089 /DNA_ORIENTATION=+
MTSIEAMNTNKLGKPRVLPDILLALEQLPREIFSPDINFDGRTSEVYFSSNGDQQNGSITTRNSSATAKNDPFFAKVSETTFLRVPRISGWKTDGTTQIRDSTGKVHFIVSKLFYIYFGGRHVKQIGNAAILADPEGNDVALLLNGFLSKNQVEICSFVPNYELGVPEKQLIPLDVNGKRVYFHTELARSLCGEDYDYSLMVYNDEAFKQVNLRGRRTESFLSCAHYSSSDRKSWGINFRNHDDEILVSIDQQEEIVTVHPGMNLLASVCIAFAFDTLSHGQSDEPSNTLGLPVW